MSGGNLHEVLGDKRAIPLLLGPACRCTRGDAGPDAVVAGVHFFSGSVVAGFTWVGFANFERLFGDPTTRPAIFFTLKYAVVITVGQVPSATSWRCSTSSSCASVGTSVPSCSSRWCCPRLRSRSSFRSSSSSLRRPDRQFASSNGGAATRRLARLGRYRLLVIALMDIWRSMGFYGVLLYTGILDMPEDCRIGAPRRRVRLAPGPHIVLPLSLPILVSSMIFSINGTLKVFDSIYALTGGGPGNGTTPLTL